MPGIDQSNAADFLKTSQNDHDKGFAALFREWYPAICYFAQSILKDAHEGKDVAEEGFIKLWEKRNEFISLSGCKSFLYTVVRNDCINILRHRQVINSNANDLRYLGNPSYNFLDNIISSEVAGQLQKALDDLPPQCRKVFNLVYLEGKSSRQVAEILQLSVHTVKAQRKRGLALLRKKILLLIFLFFSLFF